VTDQSRPQPGQQVQKPTDASFHIAFCVDDHYFRSMGATIASIVAHNPDVAFTFHVFTFAISDDQRARLARIDAMFNVKTSLHLVQEETFKDFAGTIGSSHYSLAIYNRLVIPNVLRDVTDRVLSLDADVLCVGSIDELVRMDISSEIAVVVPDAPRTTERRCAALKLKHHHYFNGGFMFINVPNWISAHVTDDAMRELIKSDNSLRFNEQDALNIVLNGRARYIDRKWNYLYDLIHDLDVDRRQMRDVGDAVFIHFAGAVKPWTDWSLHESRALFMKYHAMSPWADLPLDTLPRNTKEMRMHSRFLARRGQKFASFMWYLKYLKARSSK
jgi:lipopolysaccharide biosynthesis glycosyltransferase